MNLAQLNNLDYENFLGLASAEEIDTLLGEAAAQPTAAAKAIAVKKIAGNGANVVVNGRKTSRQELEARFNRLPDLTKEGLKSQSLQIADMALYASKAVGGLKSIKMFTDDDRKSVGTCNLSSGKLEKGNITLLTGIILLSGVAGQGETEKDVDFDVLNKLIRNGEFELKANGTFLTPSNRTSCEVFDTEGMTCKKGLYLFDSPKLIETLSTIELNIEWGTAAAASTYLKAVLIGSMITKY